MSILSLGFYGSVFAVSLGLFVLRNTLPSNESLKPAIDNEISDKTNANVLGRFAVSLGTSVATVAFAPEIKNYYFLKTARISVGKESLFYVGALSNWKRLG